MVCSSYITSHQSYRVRLLAPTSLRNYAFRPISCAADVVETHTDPARVTHDHKYQR